MDDDQIPTAPTERSIAAIEDAEGVERAARALYGGVPTSTGVVHVASGWLRSGTASGPLTVLDVGAETAPRSALDAFALGLARARADAIVTTGEILRRERALRHVLDGPGTLGRGLTAWRRERLAKSRPPVSLVLTSGRDLDLDHPLFEGPTRAVVFTDRQGAWRLESLAMDRGVEIVAHEAPGARAAVDFLRGAFGAATVLIEAGPSVARRYYEEPPMVDELMLTLLRSEALDPAARGPSFLSLDEIERRLSLASTSTRVETDDGTWRFLRFLR